jgi:hypothetical protein
MTTHGSSIPPWHLWGSTAEITLRAGGQVASAQLARISYNRPDTWSFFFFAKLLSGPDAGTGNDIFAVFDVTIGVGRSQVDILGSRDGSTVTGTLLPGLVNLRIPSGSIPGAFAFANSGQSQGQLAGDFITALTTNISEFPAQDIQCACRVTQLSTVVGPQVIQLGAFFAPRTHIRPDWFSHENERHIAQFSGERGGR